MLSKRAGVETTHVPYKGADALNDLLAGRVQFMFATIPSVIQHIQAGKLRALAVTSVQRSRSLPDVPTVAEKGFPGFEAGSWFGFFAPKGTPEGGDRGSTRRSTRPCLRSRRSWSAKAPTRSAARRAVRQFVQKEYEKWRD